MMLTREEKDTFFGDGYLVRRQVIHEEERTALRIALQEVVARVRSEPTRYKARFVDPTRTDIWGCSTILGPALRQQVLLDYLANSMIQETLQDLLGPHLRF